MKIEITKQTWKNLWKLFKSLPKLLSNWFVGLWKGIKVEANDIKENGLKKWMKKRSPVFIAWVLACLIVYSPGVVPLLIGIITGNISLIRLGFSIWFTLSALPILGAVPIALTPILLKQWYKIKKKD